MLSTKVQNLLKKELEGIYKQAISDCSVLYNFNVEEALEKLRMNMDVEKVEKIKKNKKMSVSYPFPFDGKEREECCRNIRYNHGLYTQCEGNREENGYCSSCKEESKEFFTIDERISKGNDYKDSKGRKVVEYIKIIKKLKLNEEEIKKEAEKKGIVLESSIFEEKIVEKKEKKIVDSKRGRPKKPEMVVEENKCEMADLFAQLVSETEEKLEINNEEKKEKEKEEKKAALEKEKAEKKAALEKKKSEKVEKQEEKQEVKTRRKTRRKTRSKNSKNSKSRKICR